MAAECPQAGGWSGMVEAATAESVIERVEAAQALYNATRFEEAAQAYAALVADGQGGDAALVGLGLSEVRCGRMAAADAAFEAISDPSPTVEAWRGFSFQCQDRHEDARRAYERALAADPDQPQALLGLGIVLLGQHLADEAEAVLRRAVAVSPNSSHAWLHLASLYRVGGRLNEAMAAFRTGLPMLDDRDPLAVVWRVECAMTALTLGDFTEGFAQFEWRLKGVLKPAADRMDAMAPRWDGRVVRGLRLLLWYEQGLGDSIHFVRYAAKLAEWGVRVILLVPAPLQRLFATIPGIEAVVTDQEELPPFDCNAALMSVPHLIRAGGRALTVPRSVPYLHPAQDEVAAWAARLDAVAGPRLKVGIAWSGNPKFAFNNRRAIPVERLKPVFEVSEAAFFSIQLGEESGRECLASLGVVDLAPDLGDYADTASAMCAMDLIVTIDTSVAHCAGALARPTWVYMPRIWDWRWGVAGTRNVWYPTMRLFRQAVVDEWDPVIADVAAALADEAGRVCAQRGGK